MKLKKTQVRASTSTHFKNETNAPAQDEAGALLNHQSPGTLIDPEDDTGGNTHTPIEASSKKNKPAVAAKKKVKAGKPVNAEFPAGSDDDEDDAGRLPSQRPRHNDEDDEEEVNADITGKDDNCTQDVGHIPNDVDPAAGYLTNASEDEDQFDDLEDPDAIEADFDDAPAKLSNGSNPQSVLEAGDEEWDDGEDEAGGDAGGDVGGEGTGDEFGADDAAFKNFTGDDVEDDTEVEAEPMGDGDDMPIVDIDGMNDDGDDVVFAAYGTRLLALKGTRAIAHMGKKLATKAGYADEYMSDEFQDACAVEMAKAGMRKGLSAMGFAMARVNVSKSDVLNKRVEAKVKTVTAAVRRSAHSSTAKLEQCMAIAAVGINRRHFKDTQNELRAALEQELQSAGVRGASKMVQRVFAQHGVSYAKAIVTLANKLSQMSQAARDSIAEALDMTDESDLEDQDDLFGDSASPNGQIEESAGDEGADADFADEFDDELDAPDTIQAALVRPARRLQPAAVTASRAGGKGKVQLSAKALAILNGDRPMSL